MTPQAHEPLERRAVVRELLAGRDELVVVTGLGSPSYDTMAAGDHDLNFYLWGAMGSAATIGLGLALAQPRRPVLADPRLLLVKYWGLTRDSRVRPRSCSAASTAAVC